ncbi:MAG: L,D-transpeptidase [Bacteroidota bacterium]|nr:L,D-transpeptidase [Bacteroidota bacterium]
MVRTFLIYMALLLVGIIFFASMILFAIPALQESAFVLPGVSQTRTDDGNAESQRVSLDKEVQKLQVKLDKFTPTNAYIIVNTSDNHFFLYKGKQLIRDGKCSTGKNERLTFSNSKKEYVFHTPQGVMHVQSKQPDPVWTKPDWAFLEDGLPIPPPGDASRYEKGTLGKYKLVLGDGYMIHGTIYKRFMGQNVTHGCIRLLDDDLEVVYKTMEVGSKVYIY